MDELEHKYEVEIQQTEKGGGGEGTVWMYSVVKIQHWTGIQ